MVKIKDIAKATGYSVTTVSKAFNDYKDISEHAKEKILTTAKQMGYVPNAHARTLTQQRSQTIGVIFDEALGYGLKHPYFVAVIEAFKETIEKEGYDLLFMTKQLGNHIETYYEHCIQRRVDGVFIPNVTYDQDEIEALLRSTIPTVSIESSSQLTNAVNTDDYGGLYQAVKYLHNLGHRDIIHLSSNMNEYAGRERVRGYKQAMEDLGLDGFIAPGQNYSYGSGQACVEWLLKERKHFTALTTSSDLMALGAIHTLNDHGFKVPEDVSVVGYDNLQFLEYMRPKLTTIAQDVKQLGEKAAVLLLANIRDLSLPKREIILPTKIVEGQTCLKI